MATAAEVYRFRPDPDEIADVLSKRVVATVGTTNADGSIHLAYVLFLFEDDRILIETSSVTRKARNVASRPAASFLVQGRAFSGRMTMVRGRARPACWRATRRRNATGGCGRSTSSRTCSTLSNARGRPWTT
ncbi:MAG: pyridoxamine 5'-phosphate oxidase family protein [Actinomycetota bacterium]